MADSLLFLADVTLLSLSILDQWWLFHDPFVSLSLVVWLWWRYSVPYSPGCTCLHLFFLHFKLVSLIGIWCFPLSLSRPRLFYLICSPGCIHCLTQYLLQRHSRPIMSFWVVAVALVVSTLWRCCAFSSLHTSKEPTWHHNIGLTAPFHP